MRKSYTLTKKVTEGKFKQAKNILCGGSDDSLFYKIVLSCVFNDFASFEVRRDIEIPKSERGKGVVIAFDDGRIAYFKTQKDQLSDEEFESILEVCYYLQDKFGGTIEAYIMCFAEVELRPYDGIRRDGITLILNRLNGYDGDATLAMLEAKLKNREKFTIQDFIDHILLPFMDCKDPSEFLPRYQRYIMETMYANAEKQGIEVIRL